MRQENEDTKDDAFDDEDQDEPDGLEAPLHWREPKIHPEILTHGAELARLAVELARIEHSRGKKDVSPLDCLHDAGVLLQRAMEMVPATANLSKPDRQEYDRWIGDHIAGKFTEKIVPWNAICAEGTRAEDAPKTTLSLVINGKPVAYDWKAYVQIEKEGGLKALLFKHAMRVCFQEDGQRWRVRRLERILELWAFHYHRRRWDEDQRRIWWKQRIEKKRRAAAIFESTLAGQNEVQVKDKRRAKKERIKRRNKTRSINSVRRHFDMEWTAPFFKQAMEELPETIQWPSLEWRHGVVKAWQEASARAFAGRLLGWARNGELGLSQFKSIALTRKLNPPGGRQRGNSGSS